MDIPKTLYCSNCDKDCEIEVRTENETYPVKGIDTEVIASVTYCKCCGKQVWNEALEEENLKTGFNKFRVNNGLLQPEEIKKIRNKYEISQIIFAKILGFDERTITRFENGSVQDFAQNNLIALSNNPDNFEKLLLLAKPRLSEPDYAKAMAGLCRHRRVLLG